MTILPLLQVIQFPSRFSDNKVGVELTLIINIYLNILTWEFSLNLFPAR